VTGRHVRPLISLAEKMLQFAKKNKECIFPGTQGGKALPRLMEEG
jgi:hypothetical protein